MKFVVWGNNLFLAFPEMDSGGIYSSKNGSLWIRKKIDSAEHMSFIAGVYSKDKFLIY